MAGLPSSNCGRSMIRHKVLPKKKVVVVDIRNNESEERSESFVVRSPTESMGA